MSFFASVDHTHYIPCTHTYDPKAQKPKLKDSYSHPMKVSFSSSFCPYPPFLLLFLLFPSPTIPTACLSLPPFSLSSCSYSFRVASLLHIQLPLCSHPHPSLLLSRFLLPDTGSLSLTQAAHGCYCLENNQENQTAAVRSKPVTQSGLSFPLFTLQ